MGHGTTQVLIMLRDLEHGTCPPRQTRLQVAQIIARSVVTVDRRFAAGKLPKPVERGIWDARDIRKALGFATESSLSDEADPFVEALKNRRGKKRAG